MKLENRLYKASEAAKILGVSKQTIYNYLQAKQITGISRSSRWYIEGSEIERFLKEGTQKKYYVNLFNRDKKEG